MPLYGRRGFPELPPFWLAMIWLWVPPVFISAVFDKWGRRRLTQLAGYALVAGFVVSWGVLFVRPSNKSLGEALVETTFYAPVLMVGILGVEAVSRWLLRFVRRFPTHPYCEQCGYCLHALTQARCPECGTSFDPEQLHPLYMPRPTPLFRRWSTLLIASALLAAAAFPFAYHE
ncbi:MAG: hypothetical protein AMXMBFR13_30690 [Phycisphaerae bacterium]